MNRIVVWALAVAAALVVVLVVAALAVPYVVDTPRMQAYIAASAAHAVGRKVTFGGMSVKVFPLPAVELRDLEVAEDARFGTEPFLRLERGDLRLQLWPLLAGRVEFGRLVLRKPRITVIQDAGGRWNFASLGASTEPRPTPPPSRPRSSGGSSAAAGALASHLDITDGVVTYIARGASGPASRYRIEGLDLSLTGAPGSVAFKGDARVMPGGLTVKFSDGSVGLAPGRTLTESAVRGRVSINGQEVRELVAAVAGPSPVITGGVKGALTLDGTVGSPRAAGDVELTSVAVTETNARCAPPKQRTLKLQTIKMTVAWEPGHLVAQPMTTGLGKGTISTMLDATLESGAHAQAKDVAIRSLPLEPVLVDFLCQGYAVTGPLDLTGTFAAGLHDPWRTLSGSGQLHIGAGKVVGSQALALLGNVARLGGAVSSLLAGDAGSSSSSSPLEYDSITGTFTITNGVVTTKDLLYTSRAMKVSLAGDYGLASGRLNFDVLVSHGRGEVQAKVTGTTASPSVRVVPQSVLRGLDREKVETGLQDLLKRFK